MSLSLSVVLELSSLIPSMAIPLPGLDLTRKAEARAKGEGEWGEDLMEDGEKDIEGEEGDDKNTGRVGNKDNGEDKTEEEREDSREGGKGKEDL